MILPMELMLSIIFLCPSQASQLPGNSTESYGVNCLVDCLFIFLFAISPAQSYKALLSPFSLPASFPTAFIFKIVKCFHGRQLPEIAS